MLFHLALHTQECIPRLSLAPGLSLLYALLHLTFVSLILGGKAVVIQLPWTPPKLMTAEESAAAAAAKAAKLEEQRRRMKDMAARRRQVALEEKEDYLEFLEDIAEGVRGRHGRSLGGNGAPPGGGKHCKLYDEGSGREI